MSSNTVPVTAIFDIGKTNKKFLLFDESFNVIHRSQAAIPLTVDDDGDPCDDLQVVTEWMKETFEKIHSDKRFTIKAVNFTTYGASFVHIDNQGNVVTPLYDYLKNYPEDLIEEFYAKYGGKEAFSLATASPSLGMLNSGLQLYWLKNKKPEIFSKIAHSLHFPQYASYLFTKYLCSELTSIGCHTAMWDFGNNTYHRWVKQEGMEPLLPPIVSATEHRSINYKGDQIVAGVGVHDSSASLAPYLMALDDPFLLVSTGTWSITLNPFNKSLLSNEELNRDCLNFMNVYGEQVRASRFLLGKEYEHQKEKLKKQFGVSSYEQDLSLDVSILERMIREKNNDKLILETVGGSGPYPQTSDAAWDISAFDSYEEAYHQLMIDLVSIQADSIQLTLDGKDIRKVIVTGGFSNNRMFMQLLATMFPDKEVYTANLSDSTALGAAFLMRKAEDITSDDFLKLKKTKPLADNQLAAYQWHD